MVVTSSAVILNIIWSALLIVVTAKRSLYVFMKDSKTYWCTCQSFVKSFTKFVLPCQFSPLKPLIKFWNIRQYNNVLKYDFLAFLLWDVIKFP